MEKVSLIISSSQHNLSSEQNKYIYVTIKDVDTTLMSLKDSSIDEIKIKDGYIPNETIQLLLFNILKPSAKMVIEGLSTREIGQSLTIDLKIQGFVDIMAAKGNLLLSQLLYNLLK